MAMNRIDLHKNIRHWGDMVVWLRENFGEAQGWEPKVLEPIQLRKSYKWAIGDHRVKADDPDSMEWPCFWVPDGAVYTAFVLRWVT